MEMRMKNIVLLIGLLGYASGIIGQSFTSFFTGNSTDAQVQAQGGICLMGGASEDDEAMKWFLNRAAGGDVLVLRTSGSDGYNSYFFSELGVTLNSVETIVCHSPNCADETYLQDRVKQAEAIWFAGGDQWTYVSYWRNTAIDSLINKGIQERNLVVGGTSAGMAIQGNAYFSAENGTVTSATALSNPYAPSVTVDATPFIQHAHLAQTLTDTHFDNPDRRGRLTVFLARLHTDLGWSAKAIACDEYTAVCIDEHGMARVFGGHPAYDDNAFFLRANCAIPQNQPETISSGVPLTWNHAGQALSVCRMKGTSTGSATFSLTDWEAVSGGEWLYWFAENGVLNETAGEQPECSTSHLANFTEVNVQIYPNPVRNEPVTVRSNTMIQKVRVMNVLGQVIVEKEVHAFETTLMDIPKEGGAIFLEIETGQERMVRKLITQP
jgi:cyanophycinase-like exopeptidase